MNEVYHIPALLPQTINALDINPDGIYVDVTFGGGGHSRAILNELSQNGHLYSFDQDSDAAANAFDDPRFTFVHGNFRYLLNFLRFYGVENVNGILADLGVSFHHFDDPDRGFSFRFDAPLDMRMNQKASLSAAQILNNAPQERIADILYLFGELKNSRQLAATIAKARAARPIETVGNLLDILQPHINPAKRKQELAKIFQALRIEVNHELDALRQFLEASLKALAPGGRLAIITYHSLEDRLVKNFLKTGNLDGREQKDFFGRNLSPFKLISSKPIIPSPEEIEANPRSRSAKLRVAQKINL